MDFIADIETLKKNNSAMKNASTIYIKKQHVDMLINSSQQIINAFSITSGMKTLVSMLKEATKNIPSQLELMERILILINRVELTPEISRESGVKNSSQKISFIFFFKHYQLGEIFLRIRDRRIIEQIRMKNKQDQIQGYWTKYYNKYKSILDDRTDQPTKKKVKRDSSNSSKKKSKKVKFPAHEDKLLQYKYFKREDEPNAKGLTEYEVQLFQRTYAEELRRNDIITHDIKHKESQMEGKSHRDIQHNVEQMHEQIPFIKPMRLYLEYQMEMIETEESKSQQKRIESKMSAFYRHETNIPPEPSMVDIINIPTYKQQLRTILLDAPKRQDLMITINQMFDRAMKNVIDKKNSHTKKALKGILKKPQEQQENQKEQLEQSKKELEPQIKQIINMIENRQNYSQEQILSLLNEILNRFKQLDKEAYIPNVKITIEKAFNSQRSINNEDLMMKQKQEMQRQREFQANNNPQLMQRARAYKTKHCHNFHSAKGCTRGDNCNFIHDQKYQGTQVPVLNYGPSNQIPNLLNKNLYPQQQILNLQFNAPDLLAQLNPQFNRR